MSPRGGSCTLLAKAKLWPYSAGEMTRVARRRWFDAGVALGSVAVVVFALGMSTARPAVADPAVVPLRALLAVEDPATAGDAEPTPVPATDAETPGLLLGSPTAEPEADQSPAVKKQVAMDEEEPSVFKTWWFWTLTAAIVGGTVGLGIWAAQPEDSPARTCSPGTIACFGDGRP